MAHRRTFAILSLIDPPAEKNSHLPTDISLVYRSRRIKLTQVALQSFFLCDPLQPDQRGMSHCIERRIEDSVPMMSVAAAFAAGSRHVWQVICRVKLLSGRGRARIAMS